MNDSGNWLHNVADSAIGFLGIVGMVALLVLNGYEFGKDEGKRIAYRDFECKGAAHMTVWEKERKVTCIPYWGKTL